MAGKADEEGMPGRITTEENEARRRLGGADPDELPGVTINPATPGQWLRLVGNAVNVSTPLGLVAAGVGRASVRRGPRGLLVAEGYRLPFPFAAAFTVGNVVLVRGPLADLIDAPALFAHEERHTWQYLYCLGLPYLPLYGLAMAWSWLRTGDRAARNVFERSAGLAPGGYFDVPARDLRTRMREIRTAFRPGRPR